MDIIHSRLTYYPENVMNEVRAMLDHIARCYYYDSKDYKDKDIKISNELSKADGHLKRLLYDCFKQLNLTLFESIKSYRKKYYSSYWLKINKGKFWQNYTEYLQKALECDIEAKKNESYDSETALNKYNEAYDNYYKTEQLLLKYKKSLYISCAIKLGRYVFRPLSWLLITIVIKYIATLICSVLFSCGD